MTDCILHIHHGDPREDRVSQILKDIGFSSQWVNPVLGETLPEDFDAYAGVVVYGGVHSVNDQDEHVGIEEAWIRRWIAADKPYLGLCLGAQFLAKALDARIKRHDQNKIETGYNAIHPVNGGKQVFGESMYVYQWHNEGFELPEGCELLATGNRFQNQAFRYRPHIVGFQFHPEVCVNLMMEWFGAGGHALIHPYAQPPESHLRDARLFDQRIEEWIRNFLNDWTAMFGATPDRISSQVY